MTTQSIGKKFGRLVEIMARLRSAEGCIWDRQQTHESLRQYLLEETYEVLESIDHQNFKELVNELGDLLLQVVFHAQIAAEAGRFGIAEVVDHISEKMIRRHPHVFGDEKVGSVQEQKLRWEEIKKKESKQSTLQGVPQALPALQRAVRLQQKANASPLSWEEIDALYREVRTLALQSEAHARTATDDQLQKNAGEFIFALAGVCHRLGVNAEDALREVCERFQERGIS